MTLLNRKRAGGVSVRNGEDNPQPDGTLATIRFGVMMALSIPVFLWMATDALPIWLMPVNHLLVVLGAYMVGDAVARRLRPLTRTQDTTRPRS